MNKKDNFLVDESFKHIAFIMDGNGRWAKARGMVRQEGHKVGVKVFERVVRSCLDMGLEAITFYAFSTENWKRPKDEVDTIMGLLEDFIDRTEKEIKRKKREVRFHMIGDKSMLSPKLVEKINNLEEASKDYKRVINVAINYGGRDEIVHACNTLVAEGKEITKENITAALYTGDCVEPDMIVRTGGEKRLSNFLLWQSSYSELYFCDTLWPDFTDDDLKKAIEDFYSRKRRFGGI